jgi:hypothetical protein
MLAVLVTFPGIGVCRSMRESHDDEGRENATTMKNEWVTLRSEHGHYFTFEEP